MLMNYSPFTKTPDTLVANDLDVLRSVSEGWYVEYKREVPKARSIAKSISAFANQYGGWVFYGIEEDGGLEGNRAAAFPGVPTEDLTCSLNLVREAAKDSIQPSPYFEIYHVSGPCDEIGLDEGRAIIVVVVPEGPRPPYVHIDGRIYVRVGDSSDPESEKDRTRLEMLWEKGRSKKTSTR